MTANAKTKIRNCLECDLTIIMDLVPYGNSPTGEFINYPLPMKRELQIVLYTRILQVKANIFFCFEIVFIIYLLPVRRPV